MSGNSHQPPFLAEIFKSSGFRERESQSILSSFKKKRFKKDDFLLKEGETSNHYRFIQEGIMRVFVLDVDGKNVNVDFFTRGDIAIDWPSFLLQKPTSEQIQAITDCTCWELTFKDFQSLFHDIEPFRESARSQLVKSYFELKKRQIAAITDTVAARLEELKKKIPDLYDQVPEEDINTYLGVENLPN